MADPGHGRPGGPHMDLASTTGIVNALKTGNIVLDMAIAMCIPVFFKMIFDSLESLRKKYQQGDLRTPSDLLPSWLRWFGGGVMCERVIEHKTTQDLWGDVNNNETDTRNSVVIKAVTLYLQELETPFVNARVSLVSTTTKNERRYYYGDDDDEREQTPAGKLKKYRLTRKAPNFAWINIGTYPSDLPSHRSASNPPLPLSSQLFTNIFDEKDRRFG